VTWDTANIPPSGQNNTGEILLGYDDGSEDEHLDYGKLPCPAHDGTTLTLPQNIHLHMASPLRPVASK
jgi:hypothetical protein